MKHADRSYGAMITRARNSSVARNVMLPAQRFLQIEGMGGWMLLAAAVFALLCVNSPAAPWYHRVFETRLSLDLGLITIDEDFRHWINDGLMAIFFFVVGLEIKRELLVGALAGWRQASLPVAAALGGMILPALIYFGLNPHPPAADGWGIPMATDIAFAVGVLHLAGKSVPSSLRILLLALAIVDDLGAILIIALFYTDQIHTNALVIATLLFAVLFIMRRVGFRSSYLFFCVSLVFWFAVLESGVHATIAGVLLAFLTPIKPWVSLPEFSRRARRLTERMEKAITRGRPERAEMMIGQLEELSHQTDSPLDRLLRQVHPWSSYVVLPLFALANAGIVLNRDSVMGAISGRITWGVFLGLVLGKPLGIALFSWLAVRFNIASLPSRVGWSHIIGVGLLAGIGFTVALFIAELAFTDHALVDQAKLGILLASLLAGILGAVFLKLTSRSDDQPDHA